MHNRTLTVDKLLSLGLRLNSSWTFNNYWDKKTVSVFFKHKIPLDNIDASILNDILYHNNLVDLKYYVSNGINLSKNNYDFLKKAIMYNRPDIVQYLIFELNHPIEIAINECHTEEMKNRFSVLLKIQSSTLLHEKLSSELVKNNENKNKTKLKI